MFFLVFLPPSHFRYYELAFCLSGLLCAIKHEIGFTSYLVVYDIGGNLVLNMSSIPNSSLFAVLNKS